MSQTIDNAVGELIKRQHGTVSYTNNGKEVVVTSKPAHYSIHVQLIDKEARKRKQSSVRLDKKYTYPKEIEGVVLWDILLVMRQAIIDHTGEQGHKSWNNTFGKRWAQLTIGEIVEGVPKKSKWADGDYANAYVAGYHKAINNLKSKQADPEANTKQDKAQ